MRPAAGAITTIAHFTVTKPEDRAPIVGLLPAVAVAHLVDAVGEHVGQPCSC